MSRKSGKNSNLSTRARAQEESDTVVGLNMVLLRFSASIEGKKPSEVGHNEDGDIEGWSDIDFFWRR